MRRKHILFTTLASCAALFCSPQTSAQEVDIEVATDKVDAQVVTESVDSSTNETTLGTNDQIRETSRPSVQRAMNVQIVDWVLADQKAFINLARFGAKNANSESVRQLSQKLVDDHQKLIHQLSEVGSKTPHRSQDLVNSPATATDAKKRRKKRSPGKVLAVVESVVEELRDGVESVAVEKPAIRQASGEDVAEKIEQIAAVTEEVIEESREVVEKVKRNLPPVAERPRVRFSRDVKQLVKLREDIAKQLTQTALADLQTRTGYEFDAALVGMYSASHLQQQATLEVMSRKASGDVAGLLKEALATIQTHREKADSVMDQITKPE